MPRADARGAPARLREVLLALALVLGLLAACTASEPDADDGGAGEGEAAPAEPDDTPPPDDGDIEPADEPEDQADAEPPSTPAPRPAADPPAPPPPPEGREDLVAHAERMVAAAAGEADSGSFAVFVADEHGREVVARAVDEPMLPASTLKIVTAAAILTTLGPDHRIETTLESTAPIGGDGTIDGDLVLRGAGDPVLATPEYGRWVYPARPRTPIEGFVDQLADAGVERIDGDVLATAPGFSGPHVPDGWPDRYFSSFDARYSDGLTVDGGLRTIVTYPEPEADETVAPGTAEEEVDPEASAEPPADEDDEVLGPPDVVVDHADQPALQAASELIRLLEDADIEVVGGARAAEPEGPVVGQLAVIESPPMLELLRFAMQRSDNHLTDGLFRLAGRVRTGEGSFAAAQRAVRQVLDRYGIGHDGAVFADGSGLSREDRVTARMLADLDRAMSASRHGGVWDSIMASMGESGTLERRLRGTIAQSRFRGKTGTLRDVTALTGAVVDAEGARYHLAVLANAEGATRAIARVLADELILLLTADVEGCAAERPGDDDGPIGLPALAVSCGSS